MQMINVRASSLSDLFDCPARWEARQLLGMRLPMSPAAVLGRAVHAGAALFDEDRILGNAIEPEAYDCAVADEIQNTSEAVDWGKETPAAVEKMAIPLLHLYCKEIAPQFNFVAVESLCENIELTDVGISLSGTIDRVYTDGNGGYGICDIKTGKNAVGADGKARTHGHALQLGVYEILAEAELGGGISLPGQVIGLQAARTDKGRRAAVAAIADARAMLLDDGERPGLLRMAAEIIRRGDFYGNSRSPLCSEKYCPAFSGCRFRR